MKAQCFVDESFCDKGAERIFATCTLFYGQKSFVLTQVLGAQPDQLIVKHSNHTQLTCCLFQVDYHMSKPLLSPRSTIPQCGTTVRDLMSFQGDHPFFDVTIRQCGLRDKVQPALL